MKDRELIDFTKRILQLQSFDRETSEVPDFICETLRSYGAEPELLEREGVRNVVATTPGARKVILNGHWDTVLPSESMRMPELPVEIEGGTMYGLGASDMKSGVAAQVAAFVECLQQDVPGVVLCVVGDEEVGGANGTKLLLERGYTAPYVILGEPTNLKLSLGQKGGMFARAVAHGALAHGAYPHRGRNAILALYEFLQRLVDTYPIPPEGSDNREVFPVVTASIGTIRGGEATNVVPESCEATIDIRIPPQVERDEVEQTLHDLAVGIPVEVVTEFVGYGWQLDQASRIYEVSRDVVAEVTGKKAEFVQKLGTNDGKYYAYAGAQITNIGPGDDRFSHTEEERVLTANLIMARDIYVEMAERLAHPALEPAGTEPHVVATTEE